MSLRQIDKPLSCPASGFAVEALSLGSKMSGSHWAGSSSLKVTVSSNDEATVETDHKQVDVFAPEKAG